MKTINRVEGQPAYILYTRPFRESSFLIEAFSRDYGRVSLVARGARKMANYAKARSSRPRFQGLLQPFTPLLLSWYGRSDLFNLTETEHYKVLLPLNGKVLVSGWYMNELLVRTLQHWDVHTEVFQGYEVALLGLSTNKLGYLRQFEKVLLTALGVMPQLNFEKQNGHVIESDKWYALDPETGVVLADNHYPTSDLFEGTMLLALENNNFQQSSHWSAMRRFLRLLLDHILEGRRIRSRDLL